MRITSNIIIHNAAARIIVPVRLAEVLANDTLTTDAFCGLKGGIFATTLNYY
ncbi:hypothetical protein GCM10010985_59720 [Caballeronia grimmiae]|uniref:Uncharacterized protein n=1 Tax=Caballeronia grimmiae TaxID=1071679 RepID=A0ABQ1S9Y7_9BURK|nr:hypothetical protein GCM10010985_59720 [Caballeronia grimmiae]